MKVDLRIKWDPRADGRVAQTGDLVEVFIEWDCPLANNFLIKGGRVGANGEIAYVQTTRTNWNQVVNYFQTNYGVTLPAQPSCPGY